jgi:ABC-type transport system involved in Fe-S cluster assembly fused permease/ATPase subunit
MALRSGDTVEIAGDRTAIARLLLKHPLILVLNASRNKRIEVG